MPRRSALDLYLPPIDSALVRDDDCKALWCAVLMRALVDLKPAPEEPVGPMPSHQKEYHRNMVACRRESWDFFFNSLYDNHLRFVCAQAGFDPDMVRGRAKELYESGKYVRRDVKG